MKKIPTIFNRDFNDPKLVTAEEHPDCDWVFNGDGLPFRKYDGTCCMIRDRVMYKRRSLREGEEQPDDFESVGYDPATGKTVGWVPVSMFAPNDQWHIEALEDHETALDDGTYELVGPKVQGNPEGYESHELIKHSDARLYFSAPREFGLLEGWLSSLDIEGLVFHHPDGRMAKIKKRDFGLPRKPE